MKKFAIFFIAILSVASYPNAQVSHGGIPWGISNRANLTANIPTYYSHPPTQDEIEEVIRYNSESTESLQFAISSDVRIDITENSQKDSLDEGILYRLAIVSPTATTIGVIFTEYNLPYGATLYLYNEHDIKGSFTSYNNSLSNKLPIAPLVGDSLVIEYFEPYFLSSDDSRLIVGKISYGILESGYSNSRYYDCEVGINCPDGNDWQKEKRAVCKIIIENTYLCSGTLINNTNYDGTPYILTANHCINDQDEVDESIFIFNFESSLCGGYNIISEQSLSGGILRATEHNTDFTLIELRRRIPSNYHPFFAGWSRSNNQLVSGVCIHHPRGFDKKISTHYIRPETSDCMDDGYNPSNFWIIKRWYHGVTEGGSSGSALFNAKHQIIGQLYGGCPNFNHNCDDIEREYSNYGKFNISWDYGNVPNKRLNSWLDPFHTNDTEIESLESCDSAVSISLSLFDGFPNITDYYATESIYTEQTVSNNQSVNYTAGEEIIFGDGFEAVSGSAVEAKISNFDCIVSCPNICVEQWIASAHIGGRVQYHVLNADYYRFEVYSLHGSLVHSSSGNIVGDIVEVWNEINAYGDFRVIITFTSSCGDEVSRSYPMHVSSSPDTNSKAKKMKVLAKSEYVDNLTYVSPNPASSHFVIHFNTPQPCSMYIHDSKGIIIRQWDYLNVDVLDIDTQGMPSGLYYITVVMGTKINTQKIVIK